jgi:hypothetical protein
VLVNIPNGIVAATAITALLLAGCAGHSIDCVTGTSSKDCAPGTIGHQQMVQERQGEDTVASIDGRPLPFVRSAGIERLFRLSRPGSERAKTVTVGRPHAFTPVKFLGYFSGEAAHSHI